MKLFLLAAAAFALAGCAGEQSALDPRGPDADRAALLTGILSAGAALILALVIALTLLAILGGPRGRALLARESAIRVGGIVLPAIVLTALLLYGFAMMRGSVAPAAGEPLRIAVIGERWWWRVIYRGPDGETFESANEIRIPAGRPIELALTSADVIHSFWVPALAGKLDMIPGRTNRLRLAAAAPGVSRGQCAEYCGGAHALMSFHVVALAPEEFAGWVERAAAPAMPPVDAVAERGRALFEESGCGGCHAIRGTAAAGRIGPDLTHFGERVALAAATLPNEPASIARWIREGQHVKPGNLMPPYRIFGDDELAALAAYLSGLR